VWDAGAYLPTSRDVTAPELLFWERTGIDATRIEVLDQAPEDSRVKRNRFQMEALSPESMNRGSARNSGKEWPAFELFRRSKDISSFPGRTYA
jgi:hypothetical protein